MNAMGLVAKVPATADGIVHAGHSTHFFVVGGLRVLTDPWFYDPAFGALSHHPAVRPSELGRLDAILVTHEHPDHADFRAMDEMDKRARVVVADASLTSNVRALGYSDVTVFAPWESRALGAVKLTAVPALHDVYEVGYVLEAGGTSLYFAGDTQVHLDLPAIAERFRPTVAVLPVDGTRIAGEARSVMTPEEAAVAARTLGVKLVMPSHAESYFSDPVAEHVLSSTVLGAGHRFAEPVARDLAGVRCAVPIPGELVPF